MDCRRCGTRIASLTEFIFYVKGEKDVFLCLAPEEKDFVKIRSLEVVKTKKFDTIHCANCQSDIGKEVPFGPGSSYVTAFGTEKVIVCGHTLEKKDQWYRTYFLNQYDSVRKRETADYFQVGGAGQNQPSQIVFDRPNHSPIVFPDLHNEDHSSIQGLSRRKCPRDYQLECYYEALQKDSISVLPTGAGKTLIASLLLHKMRLLNRERMGLFIVDKIPLVYQQRQAIINDTGLRVAAICGHSKTLRMIQSLHDDSFDVVVCTAGVLDHLLQAEMVYLEMFSCIVFDEAHHCTGKHKYSEVLDRIYLMPAGERPRLLGLTASPFIAPNIDKARKNLALLTSRFKTYSIHQPSMDRDQTPPTILQFAYTDNQTQYKADVLKAYNKIAETLNMDLENSMDDLEDSCKLKVFERIEISQMKGDINGKADYFENVGKDISHLSDKFVALKAFIESIDVCECLGVKSAVGCLKQLKLVDEFPVDKYDEIEEISPRLEILHKELDKKYQISEASKILVFASTRVAVSNITEHLKSKYPDFKPSQVVGHGGYDGQHWVGGQEDIIGDFKSDKPGKCQLLVCTTVLEEGIDVSECDLVVRYTGVNTLIQFIQSRGRARKTGSRFVVIGSREEMDSALFMESQEKVMNMILNEHAKKHELPTQLTKDLLANVTDRSRIFFNSSEDEISRSNVAVEIYLKYDPNLDSNQVQQFLEDELTPSGLEIERILIKDKVGDAKKLSNCPLLFERKDIMAHCLISSQMDDETAESYQRLTQVWKFRYGTERHPIFTRYYMKSVAKLCLDWKVSSLGVGAFAKEQLFTKRFSIETESDITLQFSSSGHIMLLEFAHNSVRYRLKVSLLKFSSLGFALASWSLEKCDLFLPLESIPYLEKKIERNWQRVTNHQLIGLLASFPVISLTIKLPEKDWKSLRQLFSNGSIVPFPVFDCRVEVETNYEIPELRVSEDIPENFPRLLAMIKDEWQVLIQSSDLSIHAPVDEVNVWLDKIRKAYVEDKEKLAKTFSTAVRLASRSDVTYWKTFSDLVKKELRNIEDSDLSLKDMTYIVKPTPKHHIDMMRMVLSPSRYIFPPNVPMATSRMSRMFSSDYPLIVVAFRDENLDNIQSEPNILQRVKDAIVNGIEILGRKYFFLCSSASQIRDHKAFFVQADSLAIVKQLRSMIISNPSEFKSTAKYISRLGLFCTSDRETFEIPLEYFEEIPDLEAKNGSLVTDGAGIIKFSLARDLFSQLDTDVVPSAFQYRCRGLKGVLVVLPDEHEIFEGKTGKILFRDSQKKFSSNHTVMGIVKESKAHSVTLNRESITLLESLYLSNKSNKERWNFPSILIEKQEKYLKETAKILQYETEAVQELSNCLPSEELNELKDSFNIVVEPYYFRLLRCSHKIAVTDLCKKSNIPVKDGCLIMGIPDYSNQLGTDEIFLQIKNAEGKHKIIEGPCLIYRNPCLHPGDLRRVIARDIPDLHYTLDALVLPAEIADYSLAESCSGGDLDGDQFSVIWDKELIPPKSICSEPCDYNNLEGSTPKESDSASEPSEIANYFADCITNDSLGRVANMHLALCDYLPRGAMDPLAKKLAESQAVAVDYPKTGKSPMVPTDAKSLVNENGYPDFMEKKGGESYPSKKVLGDLYRSCKSYLFRDEIDEEENRKFPLDADLLIPDSDEFVKDADVHYQKYSLEMKKIINQYSLKSEEEVILGRAVAWHPLLKNDKEKVCRSLKESYKSLKEKYYNIFLSSVSPRNIHKKASAWYAVAYNQNRNHKGRPYLSFAWIVQKELCQIKGKRKNFPDSLLFSEIGSSAVKYSDEAIKDQKHMLEEKQEAFLKIKDAILQHTNNAASIFDVQLYGSCSLLLCERDSDIDVCAEILPTAANFTAKPQQFNDFNIVSQSKMLLEINVSPAVDKILHEKFELLKNDVPLIKGTVDDTKVDITCNPFGVLKTKYLLALFEKYPEYFITFRIIIQWSRFSGLIKHSDSGESLFETSKMYALLLHILDSRCPDVEPTEKYKSVSLPDLAKEFMNVNKNDELSSKVGDLILYFFRDGQNMPVEELSIKWPQIDVDKVHFTKREMEQFRKTCAQGLHILLATRNIKELLKNAKDCNQTETEYVKKLPLSLSKIVGLATDYWKQEFEIKTGTTIEILDEPGEDRLVMKSEGSRYQISQLRNYVYDLVRTKKLFSLGIPNRLSSKYFMAGSTFATLINSSKLNCKLGFVTSRGGHQPMHKVQQRSSPVIKFSPVVDTETWIKDVAVPELANAVVKQAKHFPEDMIKFIEWLEAGVTMRFGTCYVLDVETVLPATQSTITLEEFVELQERKRSMRTVAERGEFKKVRKSEALMKKFLMTSLEPGRPTRNMEGEKKSTLNRRAEGRKIATSFSPGIFNPLKDNPSKAELKSCWDLYSRVLTGLGFEEGHIEMKRLNENPHWAFSISVSTGYEVTLTLDNDMKFMSLNERNLSYVHATFFHGQEVEANLDSHFVADTDIRFHVQSRKPVLPDSNLFKMVFPDGDTDSVPVELCDNGVPRIKDNVDGELRRSIGLGKFNERIKYYKKDGAMASIISGQIFAGHRMQDKRGYCDISLYFPPDDLLDALDNPSEIQPYIKKMLALGVQVSDRMKQEVTQFNAQTTE